MTKQSLVFLILIAFFLAACAPAKVATSDMGVAPQAPREAESVPSPGKSSEGSFGAQVDASQVDRMVLKNASLTIVVEDPVASMDAIAAMAESMGGFVVTSNAYKTQTDSGVELPQASITVRVPVEKLTTAMQTIKDLVENPKEDVLTDQVSGEDVTQQYTDLKSRLRNLENAEAQLQEIMGSAKDTQDVLATYNQLVSVQEQIEVLKGQIQYYEQAAALSSISVSIVAKASIEPLTIGSWKPQGTARNAVQALVDTLQFLGKAIIWVLLYAVPVILVLFVIVFLPLRWLLRRLRKNKTPRQPTVSAPPTPQS